MTTDFSSKLQGHGNILHRKIVQIPYMPVLLTIKQLKIFRTELHVFQKVLNFSYESEKVNIAWFALTIIMNFFQSSLI